MAVKKYCYRRILHLNWTMKVTNREVRRRLNTKSDPIQIVTSRKLCLFGHYMQNEGRQENKKCDVRNCGWEGTTGKT